MTFNVGVLINLIKVEENIKKISAQFLELCWIRKLRIRQKNIKKRVASY